MDNEVINVLVNKLSEKIEECARLRLVNDEQLARLHLESVNAVSLNNFLTSLVFAVNGEGRIPAIKEYRALTGAPLKEARDIIDNFLARLRHDNQN